MNAEWFRKNRVLVAVGAAVVVLAIVILMVVQYRIGVRNDGEARQERVEQLYDNSRNSLSTCLDQGQIAAQVTEQEFESLKEILVEVVGARYVSESSASAVIGGGQLFSAVVEAYPQIDQRSWQNLQTVVVGCRSEFQGAQNRLLDEAQQFDTWMLNNSIWNSGIKSDFPTDDLTVVNLSADSVETGQDALEYMTRVITVEDANTAFETGELGEQDLFGDTTG